MTSAVADPGSFRDPGGRIFIDGDHVLRAVMPTAAGAYEAVRDSGLLSRLIDKGMLLAATEVDHGRLGGAVEAPSYVLEHPRIPLVSYPYEWSFPLHKKAALLQLDLHLEALKAGFTLSDATAYNIQFTGVRPVFIDHLSLRPYREGEYWLGHRQFCMQFLNPLLMWSLFGVAPNPWFRGGLEGIAPEDLAPLLPLKSRLSLTVLTHVIAQAALQKRSIRRNPAGATLQPGRLSPTGFRNMLSELRHFVAGLKSPTRATVWADYAENTSYSADTAAAKRAFVAEMVASQPTDLLIDLGCNTGDYSEAGLDAGARYVAGFDFDFGALERAHTRFEASGRPFLPLWLDAANPSPAQGWHEAERKSFSQRVKADALIALALIHHVAIGRNVPLPMAVDWLVGLAPRGIIEFPPKSDPMVQQLLALREDIFPDYTPQAFRAAVENRARIVRTLELTPGGRQLVWYDRTAAA